MNPDLDLALDRVIRAPRAAVWRAWTDPARFAQWWIPQPAVCRVESLAVRPGGGLVTSMSDDGVTFVPHLDATFLVVDDLERIVFTNALDSTWRPADPQPVAMTAEITFGEHPDGTDYRVLIRHGDPSARDRHEKLGFLDGWGTVTSQLASVAAGPAGR
ncbi:SRPBCC domain-containing protein [Paractinoplanes maris]|uniref:SRPBCC domain-containing protein n=1 Tax=Paractinoplanes maris TaxID=1734446 RepID=UPI002020AE24|nr:SRPBCC domain-containing protein [Actinoplanes maris]